MANPEHLAILAQGVESWNEWRRELFEITPDLRRADLREADLRRADFREADLSEAGLEGADLREADLRETNLEGADLRRVLLSGANLRGAYLRRADLREADLSWADLSWAYLNRTDLHFVNLRGANLSGADLSGADLTRAHIGDTNFGSVDLSQTLWLDQVSHYSPSHVGIDTIYLSQGKIPEEFLRGCGVPEIFIRFIPSLVGAIEPFQLYSCFISYSTKDEEFAKRLHSRLRDARARVWFAPEDIEGGKYLEEQIERAIQVHDRLLIVLSEHSLNSKWVMTEMRKARQIELKEKRRKLFPIRLTNYERLQEWQCIDPRTGEDLALEVQRYFIPDFSNWKDHDSFEAAFDRLLRDLRAEEKRSDN